MIVCDFMSCVYDDNYDAYLLFFSIDNNEFLPSWPTICDI